MALVERLRWNASVWTISLSWVRRIYAECCETMLAIATTSKRTGRWIKMRGRCKERRTSQCRHPTCLIRGTWFSRV